MISLTKRQHILVPHRGGGPQDMDLTSRRGGYLRRGGYVALAIFRKKYPPGNISLTAAPQNQGQWTGGRGEGLGYVAF